MTGTKMTQGLSPNGVRWCCLGNGPVVGSPWVFATRLPSGGCRIEVRVFGWGWILDEVAVADREDPRTNAIRGVVDALLAGEPLELAIDRLGEVLPEDHPFCRAMASGWWKEVER